MAGIASEHQQQVGTRKRIEPCLFLWRRRRRLSIPAERDRKKPDRCSFRSQIRARRVDEIERLRRDARVADEDEPGPAAALLLHPAGDWHRMFTGDEDEVRPGRNEGFLAYLFHDGNRACAHAPAAETEAPIVDHGAGLEREAQLFGQSIDLRIIARPVSRKDPDTRKAHPARTRRYSRNNCRARTSTIAAVPMTNAAAAPARPNRHDNGATIRR